MNGNYNLVESTIMVIDMPGFSKYVSSHDIHSTFTFLNNYYNVVGNIIYSNSGKIIKYIGDGILIYFENDNNNSSDNAVKSAIKINKNKNYIINCSIHFGSLIIGEIGHPKLVNIDIIGDTINIAYRQLYINNKFNIESPFIFITEQTKEVLKNIYKTKNIGCFVAKGMDLEINSYQIFE